MMKEKDEIRLSRILSKMQGTSEAIFPWGKARINVEYINYSAGGKGCPDSLLVLKITLPVLGKDVSLQIPLLIEAEKAGISAAMEDLEKFCKRSMLGTLEGGGSSFVEIPMLVVTRMPKPRQKRESATLKAHFRVQEVAFVN